MIKTDAVTCQNDGDWLTLQEVSRVTGKSVNALNLLISRKKIDRTRKVNGKGQGKWLIHKDSIDLIPGADRLTGQVKTADRLESGQVDRLTDRSEPSIPLDYHDRKLQEWLAERDRLQAGLMMYRYKFEEIEHKLRLLPAPPEMVAKELEEKAVALAQAEKIVEEAKETQKQYAEAMKQLMAKLQEEEHVRETYRVQWEASQAEMNRPWWQKIWRKR